MRSSATRGRHARRTVPAPRAMGPVTAANAVFTMPSGRLRSAAARGWPALPPLSLALPAVHGTVLAYADEVLGYDAVLCLLACLAVTPFITVARARVSRLRWWYGTWMFTLALAAALLHALMPAPSAALLPARMAGTATDWTGLLITTLLLPMAATSCAAAQRRLGPEWKRWQRWLVWSVWTAVLLHLVLLEAWLPLAAYGAASVPLVVLRVPRARKAVREWRRGGYSTGGWWAGIAFLGSLFAAGVTALAVLEVRAVATAVTGA